MGVHIARIFCQKKNKKLGKRSRKNEGHTSSADDRRRLLVAPITSEVLHFEILGAGLLAWQWVVQHHFGLRLNAFIELAHRHVTQAFHVLADLVVGLQL